MPPSMPPPIPPRDSWSRIDDVEIEEGFPPQFSPAPQNQSGVAPAPGDPPSPQENFAPGPPTEIRRPQRRMPEVGDFPAIGQREYYAKSGNIPDRRPAHARPEAARPEPARKPGLLARITGRARSTRDSGARDSHVLSQKNQVGSLAHDGFAADNAPNAERRRHVQAQNIEERPNLPAFFSKDRR
jgi:cell division protein FtsZ